MTDESELDRTRARSHHKSHILARCTSENGKILTVTSCKLNCHDLFSSECWRVLHSTLVRSIELSIFMGHFQLPGAIASFGWYYCFFSERECALCAYFCFMPSSRCNSLSIPLQHHLFPFYYNLCLVIVAVAVCISLLIYTVSTFVIIPIDRHTHWHEFALHRSTNELSATRSVPMHFACYDKQPPCQCTRENHK